MTDASTRTGVDEAEFYLTLFDQFPALIWRANLAGECDWFNKTWLEFTGRTMEQEYGNGWAEGVHAEDLDRCVGIWVEKFEARTPFDMEYRLKNRDGQFRWIRDYGRPFHDPTGRFAGFIGACYDITDLRNLTEELEHLATHDALTEVSNRRAFEVELARAISFAGRGRVSTMLFTDVDRFKACNDLGGHQFGDRVLKEIAKAIRSEVREVDFVARIGGDEFAVLLWDHGAGDVDDVTRRLEAAVKAVGVRHGVDIGLSVGVAEVTADGDVGVILSEADQRMYVAKRRA